MLPRPVVPQSPAAPDPGPAGRPPDPDPPGAGAHPGASAGPYVAPPLDPSGTEREFWGADDRGGFRGHPGAWVERLERWRRDPRAGVALLVAAALVAGLVWYQLGSRSASASPPGGSPSEATSSAASSSGGSSGRPEASEAGTAGTAPGGGSTGDAAATAGSPRARPDGPVTVHVAGAVTRPGVVELRTGARVIDAIEAAGGARPEADLDRLNLAAPLVDGQRIAVARAGEPPPPLDPGAAAGPSPGGDPGAVDDGGPLNLNAATPAQLEELPGVGPVLAQAILRERDRRGGFRRVEDLRSVRGIGDKRFADLKPLVTV